MDKMGLFDFLFGSNDGKCRECGCELKDEKSDICAWCLSESNTGGHGRNWDDDDDPMLFGSGE